MSRLQWRGWGVPASSFPSLNSYVIPLFLQDDQLDLPAVGVLRELSGGLAGGLAASDYNPKASSNLFATFWTLNLIVHNILTMHHRRRRQREASIAHKLGQLGRQQLSTRFSGGGS